MNARSFAQLSIVLFILLSGSVAAQFDDLYYDYKKDKTFVSEKQTKNQTEYYEDDSYSDNEDFYEDDQYEDYSYGTRIRRFHRPIVQNIYYSNFDSWWNNDYYYDPYYLNDPFWPNNNWNSWGSNYSINVFIGSPFMSYTRWNRWNNWGYNSWASWNNPWAYNAWNRPWGWNSWHYPSYYTSYGWNNWAGNGWHNLNGNTSPENNVQNYGSRKGGSISSAVGGRDASPRRENIAGNTTDLNKIENIDKNVETRTSSRSRDNNTTSRIYRGDLNNNSVRDNSPSKNNEATKINRSAPESRRSAETGPVRSNERNAARSNETKISPRIYDSGASSRSNNRSSGNESRTTPRNNNWDSGSSPRSNTWDSGSSSRSSSSWDSGSSRSNSTFSGSSSSGSSSSSSGSSRSSKRGGG